MDILDVVANLERHRQRLTDEIKDLTTDSNVLRSINLRHGTNEFDEAIKVLRQRTVSDERALREVTAQLDLFRLHVAKGQAMCRKLSAPQK